MIVITRVHDGFERRIAMRHHEILPIGRAFVARSRNVVPADLYVSERTPCVLRRRGARLLLQNPHSNSVRLRDGEREVLKRGRECDVTQRNVRFCPNDTTEGVERTDLTFRLEEEGSETEGEEEGASPVYSLDPGFQAM